MVFAPPLEEGLGPKLVPQPPPLSPWSTFLHPQERPGAKASSGLPNAQERLRADAIVPQSAARSLLSSTKKVNFTGCAFFNLWLGIYSTK